MVHLETDVLVIGAGGAGMYAAGAAARAGADVVLVDMSCCRQAAWRAWTRRAAG